MRPGKIIFLSLCANLMLSGCMTVTINNWADHNSTITCTTGQDKPVQASPYIRTTGEDIGQAVNAALGGVSVEDLVKQIRELRSKLEGLKESRIYPSRWRLKGDARFFDARPTTLA